MPYVHEKHAQMRDLAEAPTLGNLHPDARAQALARMTWLHSARAVDADGYEWGVFRVRWENGRAVDVQRTLSDQSDIDAAIAAPTIRASERLSPPSVRVAHIAHIHSDALAATAGVLATLAAPSARLSDEQIDAIFSANHDPKDSPWVNWRRFARAVASAAIKGRP